MTEARHLESADGVRDGGGLLFDHYQVERTLGHGAMGVVYLARDLRIGRRVALKTLPRARRFESSAAEEAFLRRFRREAELCGSLLHPNVVALYDVGWEGRRISYLAMEYVDGESLLSLLQREERLPLEAAVKIASDILTGLAFAHGRDVIHRDVKPANILISAEGEAKIADFGVARWARSGGSSATLTDNGQIIGTPYYMSPEMIAGYEITPVSDLFSVGVVLFEMLTGRKPFQSEAVSDILWEIVNAPAPDLTALHPETPAWMNAYVRRLLSKKPAERFASAAEARHELRRLAGQPGVETNPLLTLPRPIPVRSSRTPEETPTTPITIEGKFRRALRLANRTIPTPLGVSVIAAMVASLLLTVGLIQREASRTEAQAVPVTSREELVRREAQLREARLLLEAGRHEESLARYRDYLARHPASMVAQEGERAALAALEQSRHQEMQRSTAEKERYWAAIQAQRERQRRAAEAAPAVR